MRLAGKVVVVTGGAVGLGRAAATRFAREGAQVVVADVREDEGQALVEELKAGGFRAMFIPTDVSDQQAVTRLFEAARSSFERVDVLYNNAAVLPADRDRPVHELSVDAWDYILGVNLRGAFFCAKEAVTLMLASGGGSIIFLGSPTGLVGCAPALTAYSTSKAGVMGLTRVMAATYARDGIRVNSIVPGTMDTPMNSYILRETSVRERYLDAVPLGRLGQPEDIEGLSLFLASDESAYCTGGIYTCDGGLTAI